MNLQHDEEEDDDYYIENALHMQIAIKEVVDEFENGLDIEAMCVWVNANEVGYLLLLKRSGTNFVSLWDKHYHDSCMSRK